MWGGRRANRVTARRQTLLSFLTTGKPVRAAIDWSVLSHHRLNNLFRRQMLKMLVITTVLYRG